MYLHSSPKAHSFCSKNNFRSKFIRKILFKAVSFCMFKATCLVYKLIYSRCDECVISRMEDSLRHSRSRINAYRALASPSLIALSSKDPIQTAFELSWELRRLSLLEHEFKCEYQVRNWSSLLFVNIIICEQYSFAYYFCIWNVGY